MNEIIRSIQLIKMYAWEKPFSALVEKSRRQVEKVVQLTRPSNVIIDEFQEGNVRDKENQHIISPELFPSIVRAASLPFHLNRGLRLPRKCHHSGKGVLVDSLLQRFAAFHVQLVPLGYEIAMTKAREMRNGFCHSVFRSASGRVCCRLGEKNNEFHATR